MSSKDIDQLCDELDNLSISVNNKNNQYQTKYKNNIGFSLIKGVEIVVAGEVIDKQYSDWLDIYNELLQ
jgi:F0F1-type ATP synthase delta subunit